MPITWVPEKSFQFATRMTKGMPLDDVKDRILDSPNRIIWNSAPWRWTLGSLDAITLVNNTQNYTLALPADYFYPYQGWITTGADPVQQIEFMPTLPTDVGVVGLPKRVSIIGEAGTTAAVRFYPKPGSLNPTSRFYAIYKRSPPTITRNNAGTPGILGMPDEWIHVYEAGVLYYAYLFSDDQRAGGASNAGEGRTQYSGQLGLFMGLLDEMKQREPLPTLDPRVGETKGTK